MILWKLCMLSEEFCSLSCWERIYKPSLRLHFLSFFFFKGTFTHFGSARWSGPHFLLKGPCQECLVFQRISPLEVFVSLSLKETQIMGQSFQLTLPVSHWPSYLLRSMFPPWVNVNRYEIKEGRESKMAALIHFLHLFMVKIVMTLKLNICILHSGISRSIT